MNRIILILLVVIFLIAYIFGCFLMVEKNNLPNNITKKKVLIKFFTAWRLFIGMIMGGFSSIIFIMIDKLIDEGTVTFTINDALFWFFVGACGIGLYAGLIWQGRYKGPKTEI